MPATGNTSRKCLTPLAMELTWPGEPVTACANILPWRSNTPAERSPASRTEVENAVRIMVCACSSTTAIRRFHMIWVWICASAALGRAIMISGLATSELNIAEAVDACVERRAHHRGRVVLGDHRRAADAGAGRQIGSPVDRHVQKFAARRIEHR